MNNWMPDKFSQTPLYLQIADYYKALITNGILSEGSKLPSRAKLVKQFNVSKSTITLALNKLVGENAIFTRPKSGCFVNGANPARPDWNSYINNSKYNRKRYIDALRTGKSDEIGFGKNVNLLKYLNIPALDFTPRECSKYGMQELRISLAEHLKKYGIDTAPENILIAPQIMETLHLLYDALVGYWSSLIYEELSITNAISSIDTIGMHNTRIPMDKYGICTTELEKALSKHRRPVLQVQSYHAPTGIVMSNKRKDDILEMARKYRLPVIELDPLREVWNFPEPVKACDKNGNVIYMGACMNTYPFEIPISWIVADGAIIEYLSNTMLQLGLKPDFVAQCILNDMLEKGVYEKLLEDARSFVKERRELALSLLDEYLSGKAFWNPKNCIFHFWLKFPYTNIRKVINNEIYSGVYPGFFFDKNNTNHLLLSPSSISEQQLRNTIERLSKF